MQARFLGAGEGDVARLGVLHHGIAGGAAGARAELQGVRGQAGLVHGFHELVGDGRRIARRLQYDGVACHQRRHRHTRHDRGGEIPRRNHHAHAQRDVHQIILLAPGRGHRLRAGQAQHFAAVELAEIDCFGDVGVGLGPGLADFVDEPGIELQTALAEDLGGAEKDLGALGGGHALPDLEGAMGLLDGAIGQLDGGLLEDTHHLLWMGRIDRANLVGRLNPLPADDQRVLATELAGNFLQRVFHGFAVLGLGEVHERLIRELAALDFDFSGHHESGDPLPPPFFGRV